jgi:hypothetical protein
MSHVTKMDWHAWHDGYDEPGSRLARRLAAVQDQIRVALTEQYAGLAPAYLVLVCGMFGNMTADDIRRTIGFCTQLCAHGGTVIWTRNRQEPDQVPRICDWFAEDGFALVRVSDQAEG